MAIFRNFLIALLVSARKQRADMVGPVIRLDVAILMILFIVVPNLSGLRSDQGKFVKGLRSREFWA